MAAKKVDITIFAASGFTGKRVVEEILKCDQTRDFSWAIAGRNKEKLSQVLDCASKKTGHDVSGVPLVIAECNDQRSLNKMAKQTRVVINCIGPCIDNYGESVGKACDRNGTHHVDISKESNVISITKLICLARKMLEKKVDKALSRIRSRKEKIGGHSSGVQDKKKFPAVETPLEKSQKEESHHPETRKKTPLVRKSTKNSPGVELGQLVGQHINENLGPVERKLEFSNIYVLSYWQDVAVLLVALLAFSIGYVFVTQMDEEIDVTSLRTKANILAILEPMICKLTWQQTKLSVLLEYNIGYVFVTQMDEESDSPSPRTDGVNTRAILESETSKLTAQEQNLWFQIFSGFTNLMRSPASPAVFLLLSDRKSERLSFCMAKIITSVAEKILPNKEDWLFLNSSELSNHKSGDSAELAEMIEENMYFSKVVVVSDIHKIPGHMAAGFHFLVDQENPKIRDAVYVFTMTIDEIDDQVEHLKAVEKTLLNSWSDLSGNILYPLITRLTKSVLHVVQEKFVGTCPLKTDSTYKIKIL